MQNRLDTQHRWNNSDDIHVFRSPAKVVESRKYLVFVSTSTSTDVGFRQDYLYEPNRTFDLAVRYYQQPNERDPLFVSADYVLSGGLSKFHSAQQFLLKLDLLDRYDGFLFLDGDVKFGAGDIDRLLAFATAMDFDLAQAATTHNSYISWDVTRASTSFMCRETSFVEVMAPYLSRHALKTVLHTFEQSISSYGLDFAWPKILKTPKIGIVDCIRMHHSMPVDPTNGPFYAYLRSINVEPYAELEKIMHEYGASLEEYPHDVAGYFLADQHNRQELTRVPLIRLPRKRAHQMRRQDGPAVLIARIFRIGRTVRLEQDLP